ncbi:hypothetical protein IC611_08500 [Proteus mirabilis]
MTGTSRHLDKETVTATRIGAIVDFENIFQQEDQLQLRSTFLIPVGKMRYSVVAVSIVKAEK